MKNNILLTTIFLLIFSFASAQNTPQSFKYQGVARDGSSVVVGGVGLQLTIHQTDPTGTVVYQERHFPNTNNSGVFSVNIGTGTVIDGTFSTINWGAAEYFLQVELDPNGGSSYTDMGTSPLLSVPNAMYADRAGSVVNDQVNDADADPTNELQNIQISGSTLSLTNSTASVEIGGTLADFGFNSGSGSTPTTDWDFIVTPVTITITSSSQKVLITSNKAMGSTASGGADDLDLAVGYKLDSATAPINIGSASLNQRVTQNTRVVMGLSATITGLSPGTYTFGLTGKSSSTNWNSNEYGYTTVLVFN